MHSNGQWLEGDRCSWWTREEERGGREGLVAMQGVFTMQATEGMGGRLEGKERVTEGDEKRGTDGGTGRR